MLDLFSGIGGISLAAEWNEIETVAFCEIEPHCQKVLRKHWPHVPIYDDIRKLTKERLEKDGVIDDARTIDIVCGGFPCQPFSVAGKQRGKEDDRHLWPEMFRVIKELRPAWVLGENVTGIIRLALDDVLADLEREGYTCRTFIIPACAVGEPHRRDRVWIVGHSSSSGLSKWSPSWIKKSGTETRMVTELERYGETLANTESNHSGRLPIGEKAENPGFISSSQDVAHSPGERCREEGQLRCYEPAKRIASGGENVADTDRTGSEKLNITNLPNRARQHTRETGSAGSKRPTQSGMGRMLDGVSDWTSMAGRVRSGAV